MGSGIHLAVNLATFSPPQHLSPIGAPLSHTADFDREVQARHTLTPLKTDSEYLERLLRPENTSIETTNQELTQASAVATAMRRRWHTTASYVRMLRMAEPRISTAPSSSCCGIVTLFRLFRVSRKEREDHREWVDNESRVREVCVREKEVLPCLPSYSGVRVRRVSVASQLK